MLRFVASIAGMVEISRYVVEAPMSFMAARLLSFPFLLKSFEGTFPSGEKGCTKR